MAFLIPENIRNDRSIPATHRRVASALAIGLDEAATAWFEPPFDPDGSRPDFVVLDPALGVLVLMVFDDEMLGALGGRLRVADAHGERDVEKPLDQASRFGMALRTGIAANSGSPWSQWAG